MAYINQERKQAMAPAIKSILKKYGLKGSLAVRHHSTLVLTVKSGKLDFIGNFKNVVAGNGRDLENPGLQSLDVNVYHYRNQYTGRVLKCLDELITAMNVGNHDNSRPEIDHFDVGFYIDVNIGRWNKPYIYQPE